MAGNQRYDDDDSTSRKRQQQIRKAWVFGFPIFLLIVVVRQLISSQRSLLSFEIPSDIFDSMFSNPVAIHQEDNNNNTHDDTPYADELGPLNIVVLYPDDWRYDAMADAQPGVVHTPFLTKLAKEGIRFTHNAVTSSICWISRATLFTGRYASQHRSHRLYCPTFTLPSLWNGSWPAMLQRYGDYFVGHVGKWQYHNKDIKSLFNFSSLHEGRHWYVVGKQKIHANDRARDDAIEFLRNRPANHNFALTVAFYPPKPVGDRSEPGAQWQPDEEHEALYANDTFFQPYNYSEAFAFVPHFLKSPKTTSAHRYSTRFKTSEMYQESMRHYYALVSGIDDACRDIVAELDEQGVLNRTLIIVTADNGMMLGAHGLAGKWHPYQESIRVPLVVHDPRLAKSKRGTTDDKYTLNLDLAPTIIKAANIEPDPRIQGRDLADIYVKRERKLLSDNGSGARAGTKFGVDTKPWREDFYYEFPLEEFPSSTSLVTRQYKYIRWGRKKGHGQEQLFDLLNDPYELHDLMTQHPPLHLLRHVGTDLLPLNVTDLLVELRLRHDELESQVKDPIPFEVNITCSKNRTFP